MQTIPSHLRPAIVIGSIILALVLLYTASPDPEACKQAKQALFQHDLKHAFGGLGDVQEKLAVERQLLLSRGRSSPQVEELYERQRALREREKRGGQEQLEREKDEACSWF